MKKNAVLLYTGFASLLILGLVVLHNLSVDGLHGRLLALCLITDTEYAKGYTNSRFRQISVGDTKEKVLALLGEPLIKVPQRPRSNERWMYSRSPSSTHYLYRELRFSDGVVVEKRHYFYVD